MATSIVDQRDSKNPGQRLLIDTSRMTVRRVSRAESTIMAALKTLPPGERATLAAMVDVLGAKKRKGRSPGAGPAGQGGDA